MKKLFFAVALLLQSAAFAHEGHAPLPTKGATVRGNRLMLSASASKAIGVQLVKVELADVQQTIQAIGSVELPWSQQAYVSTLIAGRVEQVLVKPGESVTAGQELARISGAELENLQLSMLQAATERSLASRLLKGQESAGDGVAGKVLLQTRTEFQLQSARFNVAWQKLRTIGLSNATLQRICDTRETVPAISLVSPIDGMVSMADARTGQIVRPTEHLYHIVDPSRVWIVGKVLEADAGLVKTGQPVSVTITMLPDEFQTRIDHIDLRLDPDRTLSVKALLSNPSGMLKPGMFGRLEIQVSAERAVVCPASALIWDGQVADALVEQSPGNYIRKPAVVAAVRGKRAEIADGLFPGDKVVTVGSHELAALFANRPALTVATSNSTVGIAAQGYVELPTDQKTFASAPIDGKIGRILVEHGQPVKRGQVLAELQSLPFKTLQLDFLQGRTNLTQAAIALDRLHALGDAVSKKELWQMQARHDGFQQEVASLRKQLAVVGLAEAEIAALEEMDVAGSLQDLSAVLPIRAPADGFVCDFDLIPGQFTAQHAQLFELHSSSKVWVRAFIHEQDAVQVKAGQTVQVALASDPAFRATGKIDRLDPILFEENRALSIWTELDNPSLQLKEGMAATLYITPSVAED